MTIHRLGTHIVECARIANMIAQHGELFLERVYSIGEIEYCGQQGSPHHLYAARWAAKEAVLKVLMTRKTAGIRWTELEVVVDSDGEPRVVLSGRAKKMAEEIGIDEILLTIAHCRTYATATAISLLEDPSSYAD
ncbi:Holo-[acyl-carrier-protein] synthase [Roseimaritima multifibrata]|uniref:Holo-[acyl-carrier-protein] synthase n=1 Tax=Roseimaritima multifibrata TaxID=1930274 RepID=A0A517MF67_9BACT|nr:holo-ACP synthase [Roseimaritima multifibrata]QDS93531.1 Holo-[acyl-carrier-protein] synthase [Roseimaritima multifibrata]